MELLGLIVFLITFMHNNAYNNSNSNPSDNTYDRLEVFLTKEEIEGIELRGEIPVIQTPVLMKQNEVVLFYCQAIKQEIKKRVIGRTGGYAGASIRIAKGFSIHTGRVAGSPVYGDVCNHYSGEFILTTQRFIFLNEQKGFDISYRRITSFQYYRDAISIQVKNTSHLLLVPRPELINAIFRRIQMLQSIHN